MLDALIEVFGRGGGGLLEEGEEELGVLFGDERVRLAFLHEQEVAGLHVVGVALDGELQEAFEDLHHGVGRSEVLAEMLAALERDEVDGAAGILHNHGARYYVFKFCHVLKLGRHGCCDYCFHNYTNCS